MQENWKWIEGYETLYMVSDHGRVRSAEREIITRAGVIRRHRERVMKPETTNKGYLRVCLVQDGERRNFRVSRLVLLAFVGEPPPGHQCHHLDGNKANNRLDNLAWVTQTEHTGGEAHPNAKLNDAKVKQIRALYSTGKHTMEELAARFGVGLTAIWNIVHRRRWAHI